MKIISCTPTKILEKTNEDETCTPDETAQQVLIYLIY